MKAQKLAPLLPSLKEKRRYLVFEAFSQTPFTFQEIKEAILKETTQFLGRLGQARAGISLLDDWYKNKGIIRVSASSLNHLKAALLFIRKINKRDLILTTRGVSGTLHKARNKFIAH